MDKLEHLTHLICRLVSDRRLKPVHISLSIAICQNWILHQFERTHNASRAILMKGAGIRSRATYHKTLKDLQRYGYVKYTPSYHPVKASELIVIGETNKNNDEPE